MKGQEGMASNCIKGSLVLILGKKNSLKVWSGIGEDCPWNESLSLEVFQECVDGAPGFSG